MNTRARKELRDRFCTAENAHEFITAAGGRIEPGPAIAITLQQERSMTNEQQKNFWEAAEFLILQYGYSFTRKPFKAGTNE